MPSPALSAHRSVQLPEGWRIVTANPEHRPMTPHRIIAAAGPSTATAATTGASVISALVVIVTGWHAWLFFAVLMAMTFELITHPHAAERRAREKAKQEHAEALSKLRRLLVPAFALALDAVMIAQSRETGVGWDLFTHAPLFALSLAWLLRLEGKAFLENVRQIEGVGVVPPGLDNALDRLQPEDQPALPPAS